MPIRTDKGDLKPIIYLGAIGGDGLLIVKYKHAPNPDKPGWWLPAPEIDFGQDPAEKMLSLVKDFGLELQNMSMAGVDSFIANGAWHLIFKYRVQVTGEVRHHNVEEVRWVTAETLPPAAEFAHGNWEVELCRFFLHSKAPASKL